MNAAPVQPTSGLGRLLTRRRAIAAGLVAAFLGVFAAVGALSRSSPSAATTSALGAPVRGTAPSVSWYWTMAVAPGSAEVLVLGTSTGIYRSSDGGTTWKQVGPKLVNATSVVDAGSTILVGGARSDLATGAVVRRGSSRVAASGPAVFASSSDGGLTWTLLHPRGLPDVAVQALAVDPTSSTTLYALLTSGQLFRSTDGARSFALASPRLGVSPWALAITQDAHFVAGDMDSGSHLSQNAKAWDPAPFVDSAGSRMVMEYAVQPTDPAHVLMTSIGIESSGDGGKTWKTALTSQVMFGPVAWSPTSAGLVYAVDFDGSVWRSSDGGSSWSRVT